MAGTGERSLASPSDEELVRRFQHGEDREGALLELYERHRHVTYAFFRRRIGIAEIAAEENQELYVTVVEHLGSFRGGSSFRTWLFQIAHHRLSHLRRRWRVHLDERTDSVPDELWGEIAGPPTSDPERAAARAQVEQALRHCLAGLPEIERVVIFGQYYAGVTLQDLSDELKLSNPSGARALLIAAQRKLKRCLEQAGIVSASVSES